MVTMIQLSVFVAVLGLFSDTSQGVVCSVGGYASLT